MDSGFYVAYAGLAARMEALDIVASNLANASTAGFKGQTPFYRALSAAQQEQFITPLNQAVNQFGVLGGSRPDLRSGSLGPTGNNTDLAIEGSGFFTIQAAGGLRYTRNGSFRLNAARQLVTEDGDPVLGGDAAKTKPVVLPSGSLTISADGTLSVDGALVAKLHLAKFAPGTPLVPEGNSDYIAPAGSEQAATDSSVRQGMLESSNLNPVEGSISLVLLQRQSDLLARALSTLNTDFNRAATQDVPRV